MKTLIKLLIAVSALCLPLLLASCDTSMLEKITSGKSFMELAKEGIEEKASNGENITLNYVVKKEDGAEKAIEIEFVFCGGKIEADESLSVNDFHLSPEKEGFTFEGWYTQPDMGGFQVADNNGNLVNETALAECDSHECDGIKCVKLYAGFIECTPAECFFLPTEALPPITED